MPAQTTIFSSRSIWLSSRRASAPFCGGPGTRQESMRSYGDVRFDPASRTAYIGEAALILARREAAVLEQRLRAAGRTVVKDMLEDQLYGFDQLVSGNALEAAISRLRRKLKVAGSRVRVEVTRGIGYRLRIGDPS